MKQYQFLKPYKHFPIWAAFPYHFDKGHIIIEDPDGWFSIDKEQGELRCSPIFIKQLQRDNFLKPIT